MPISQPYRQSSVRVGGGGWEGGEGGLRSTFTPSTPCLTYHSNGDERGGTQGSIRQPL